MINGRKPDSRLRRRIRNKKSRERNTETRHDTPGRPALTLANLPHGFEPDTKVVSLTKVLAKPQTQPQTNPKLIPS